MRYPLRITRQFQIGSIWMIQGKLGRGLLQPNKAPFRNRINRLDRDRAKSRLSPSTFLGVTQGIPKRIEVLDLVHLVDQRARPTYHREMINWPAKERHSSMRRSRS